MTKAKQITQELINKHFELAYTNVKDKSDVRIAYCKKIALLSVEETLKELKAVYNVDHQPMPSTVLHYLSKRIELYEKVKEELC